MGLPVISSPCLGLCGGCCHFVQFSKVKFQCQHLSLLYFPNIRYQIFMKLWQTWMSELSAKIFLSVLFSISPLISQHPVLLLQKCWSKKTLFFPIDVMYVLAAFAKILYLLGIFLAYFHFWQCMQLCLLFLLCCCFELCLPYCLGLFSFFFFRFLDTVSCKSVVICDKPHSIR